MINDSANVDGPSSATLAAHRASESPLLVAVMAAGASRRLGQPKQLVAIGGEPLLRRQCRLAIESQTGPVAVILGCHASRCAETILDLPVARHRNRQWTEGMASSIRQAVRAAMAISAGGLLLLHVDQYRLTTTDLQSLHSAWLKSRSSGCAAVYGDDFGPPVIIPRQCFPEVLQLRGDVGARRVLAALPAESVRRIPMPNALHDLDVPDQLVATGHWWRNLRQA